MSKALAADCAMAQGDRVLHQFAPANFKYDGKKKAFSFIDNTQSSAAGTLVDKMTRDGFMNARASFNEWADVPWVGWLRTDLDSLANKLVDNFTGCDANGDANYTGIIGEFDPINANGRAERQVKTEIFNELKGIAVANRSKMVGAAKAGLEAGRSTVIKKLANPLPLTQGIRSQQDRVQAATSLVARQLVLTGSPKDAAWDAANAKVLKLLKLPFKPAVPALDMASMPKLPTG
jgi:hypothetical protein